LRFARALRLSMGEARRGTDELRAALALTQRRGGHTLASEIRGLLADGLPRAFPFR
jgi:hypothetical protein